MRLIDADALKGSVFSKSDNMEDLWDTVGVLNLINNAPTIDAFEVVGKENEDFLGKIGFFYRPKGKWIYVCCYGDEFPQCSVCGEINDVKTNFCPDCGADMRKGGTK